MENLDIQKDIAGGQERNRLNKVTRNGEWISALIHHLNGTELSWEEFRDNIRLRYGLMPQETLATYNGCGKKFLIEHALSCPKGDLVLEWHDDAAKEWGALGDLALGPSSITYKPKTNSRKVQGERTGSRARQEGGTAKGGAEIVGEAQGSVSSGWTVNGAAVLARRPGQVEVPTESRADVSAHGFWKRGTNAMFDNRIVNLNAGSYLLMKP